MNRKIVYLLLIAIAITLGTLFLWHRSRVYENQEPFRQGVSALKEGDYKSALNLLKPFADNGNVMARRLVGEIYAFGLGVDINNLLAEKFFSCEGLVGCVEGEAEYYVAINFISGNGVTKDIERAKYWMKKSAEKGYLNKAKQIK